MYSSHNTKKATTSQSDQVRQHWDNVTKIMQKKDLQIQLLENTCHYCDERQENRIRLKHRTTTKSYIKQVVNACGIKKWALRDPSRKKKTANDYYYFHHIFQNETNKQTNKPWTTKITQINSFKIRVLTSHRMGLVRRQLQQGADGIVIPDGIQLHRAQPAQHLRL